MMRRFRFLTLTLIFLLAFAPGVFSETTASEGAAGRETSKELSPTLRAKGKAAEEQKEGWYLIGQVKNVGATVQTDKGKQRSKFKGEIIFEVIPDEKLGPQVRLSSFNLVGTSVETRKGKSGVISMSLSPDQQKVAYSHKDGKFESSFQMDLHYPLIDEMKGYQKARGKKEKDEEVDDFISYTEGVKCKLSGKFKNPLELKEKGEETFSGKMSIELDDPVLGYIKLIDLSYKLRCRWICCILLECKLSTRTVCIQPVFVRSGPDDPSPTGGSFNTMMNNAKTLWKKCCVEFDVQDPVYVDNAAYKELSGEAEAVSLKGEVSDDDCIEIFVASEFDPVWDGGGACWSGGTASAKIVTCDQQLDVPGMGAVNQNHLAHELGHALTLCHPGDGCTDYRVDGTAGTVMEPSGFYADNPSTQSKHNCDSASNPLLQTIFNLCCGKPDID